MTAFVVLAFLENRRHVSARQRNAMNRGISYVAESWRETDEDSPYALALSAYVLQLADHPQKGVAFQLLDSRYGRGFFYKKNKIQIYSVDNIGKVLFIQFFKMMNFRFLLRATRVGDLKYFRSGGLEGDSSGNPWTSMPNSANVEMTSYALLTTLLRNDFEGAIPLVRWLLTQQNARGGFASTADTYAAVEALKEFSTKANIPSRGSDISVQYTYLKTVRRMRVRSEEPTVMKRRILPAQTREIK